MAKTQIDSVRMTREIREAHAEALKNASMEDHIRFYREKAHRVHSGLGKQPTATTSEPKLR
ncbi:MAG: hypothetical protein ABIV11_08580 [Gemmatimonadaceae bacterium]